MGQQSVKEASNRQKLYIILLAMESLKIFRYVSIAQRVRVSHAFVYNAVDVIAALLPSYMNTQLT